MADRRINDLTEATSVENSDLFVLEQTNKAKKLTGATLLSQLARKLDGHGGIKSIAKTSTVGLTDTYTITFADRTTATYTVKNGEKGETGNPWYVHIKYSAVRPTKNSDMYNTPDKWIGIYSGVSQSAPASYSSYSWFEFKGEQGDKGEPANITKQIITYQSGTSPTIEPSGTWHTSIPIVAQGNYLWTRIELYWNNGLVTQAFSVSRMGLDGSGSVGMVNSVSPDSTGNVTLTAGEIIYFGTQSVAQKLDTIPTRTSELQNDSGFISSYTETDPTVPAWAKESTKPTYTAEEVGAAPQGGEATHSKITIGSGSTAPTLQQDGSDLVVSIESESVSIKALAGRTVGCCVVTIPTDAWEERDGYCVTSDGQYAPGVTADNIIIVSSGSTYGEAFNEYSKCGVRAIAQGPDAIQFYADSVPAIEVSASVAIFNQ